MTTGTVRDIEREIRLLDIETKWLSLLKDIIELGKIEMALSVIDQRMSGNAEAANSYQSELDKISKSGQIIKIGHKNSNEGRET